MPRIGKSEIADRMVHNTPRLVVINSSTSQGRMPVMLRMRPSVLERLKACTVGPTYLLIEHALEKLMDELDAMPAGTIQSINAAAMDPTAEDRELLAQTPAEKAKRAKAEARNASDDHQGSGATAGPKRKGRPPKN